MRMRGAQASKAYSKSKCTQDAAGRLKKLQHEAMATEAFAVG